MALEDTPEATARPIGALAALSLAMLLSSLGTSVANVALPTLERDLGAPYGQVQWVVLAYLLAVTSLVVSAGRLGDIAGRRRLLLAGLALFTAASALCAVAPTLPLLVAARGLQGLGAALMMALALAFVAQGGPARTGTAMGLMGTTSALGTALGPSLGGALIAGPGWRAIFLVNVPLGLIALLLAHRHLPADRRHADVAVPGFDLAGTLLLALTLSAYCLAMTIGHGHVGAWGAALLGAALAGAALFVRSQLRATTPLVRLALLRDPALSSGLATSALVSTVMMATLVVGPFYLARTLALDPAQVGLVLSLGPALVVLAGVPAGRIVDRLGPGLFGIAGLASMATGTALLALTPARLGVPGYVAPIVVLTVGYAIFQTANNTAVMNRARDRQRGLVSGLLNLSRNLGLITGASLLGGVFTLAAGTTELTGAPPADVATGMHATFAIATVLVAAALALSVIRARRQDQPACSSGLRASRSPIPDATAAAAAQRGLRRA